MKNTKLFIANLVVLILFNLLIVWYIAVLLLPSSLWFNYISLENVSARGDIVMASRFEKPRAVTLRYNDVLFCDFGNGTIRFSSSESSSVKAPSPLKTSLWKYEGKTPSTLSVCLIRSDITAKVLFDIEKTASVSSQMFAYTP